MQSYFFTNKQSKNMTHHDNMSGKKTTHTMLITVNQQVVSINSSSCAIYARKQISARSWAKLHVVFWTLNFTLRLSYGFWKLF